MPLSDSQITLTEVGGTESVTLDVYIMPVECIDAIDRDINGLTYQRDVATAAYIQEVIIRVHRCALTRAVFDTLWTWSINATSLDLIDLANDVPIASYVGKIARFQPDMFHRAKIGTGPFDIVFKPDSAARP